MQWTIIGDNQEFNKKLYSDLKEHLSDLSEIRILLKTSNSLKDEDIKNTAMALIDYDCDQSLQLLNDISLHKNIMIAIISDHSDIVFDLQQFNLFFFMRKDHYNTDLNAFTAKCYSYLSKEGKPLYLKKNGITHCIRQSDIYYIIGYGHLVSIVGTRNITFYSSINRILTALTDPSFVQIERSSVINLNYVQNIDHNIIKMCDSTQFTLGRKYKKVFLEKWSR